MTTNFMLPAVWGLDLRVSFIGYGKRQNRMLFTREALGLANQALKGMALFIVLSGWINRFYLISAPLLLLLIAAGRGDLQKLRLTVSVNSRLLPYVGYINNCYLFSLSGVKGPITRIGVDTIEIKSAP